MSESKKNQVDKKVMWPIALVFALGIGVYLVSSCGRGTRANPTEPAKTGSAQSSEESEVARFVGRWRTAEKRGSIHCEDGTTVEPEMRDDVFQLTAGQSPGALIYHQGCEVGLEVSGDAATLSAPQTCQGEGEGRVTYKQIQIRRLDDLHLELSASVETPFQGKTCTISATGRAERVAE